MMATTEEKNAKFLAAIMAVKDVSEKEKKVDGFDAVLSTMDAKLAEKLESGDVKMVSPDLSVKETPLPAKPGIEAKTGSIQVTKVWTEAGTRKDEKGEEELIEVKTFSGVPLATVGFNCRMTLNLGNYESVQIGVIATVPCYKEEMEDAFIAAKKFVDLKLNAEVSAIRDYRAKKKTEV